MKRPFLLLCALMATFFVHANDDDSLAIKMQRLLAFTDSVNNAMNYQTGLVTLPNGVAELQVPEGFKFLNREQSNYILTDVWGNPADSTVLGMIFPASGGPIVDSSYAFVVSFDPVGYVKDDDAEDIDYDQMLKDTWAGEKEENQQRSALGYSTIHLVRWAQKPYYDKENKVLHWAKELEFDGDGDHTLNYDVRILGRKGILSLNAVATMDELGMVKADVPKILHIAHFTEGNAYSDFDPGVDKVAAWSIGALVAGKLLAKAGLFAIVGKFLLAAWKFILVGIIAVWGGIKKFFKRKDEEVVFEPAPAPEEEGK